MSDQSTSRRRWRLPLGANPIVVKELRSRMRGGRAFVLLTGFLVGLGLVGYGLFLRATSGERFGQPLFSAQIGQTLFAGLAFTLLFLVCLVAPAVTVSAISSERERLTYEMLVSTALPPWRLLWGKLIASLSYVALLLIAAVPLGSIVYLFGGITARNVVQAAAIIVLTAITCAMIGIWASAITGRTGRAAVLAYLLIGVVLGGLLFSAEIWTARSDQPVPQALLTPNPISALASSVAVLSGPSSGFNGAINTMAFLGDFKSSGMPIDPSQYNTGLAFPGWQTFSIGIYPPTDPNAFGPNGLPIQAEPRSTWRTTLVIELMVCLGLFWMSLHAVRPRRRWRITWGDLGMLSLSAFTLVGLGIWRGWWLS